MKTLIVLTACALACSVSVAQTASSAMGGASAPAAMKSDMKSDMKKGTDAGMPMAAESGSHMGMGSMDLKAMDANGDGMISKKEWTDYHTMMWGKMKATKDMVSLADMKTALRGGMSDGMPMKSGSGSMTMSWMDMDAMDTNGDGMVSKKEWMSHHTKMWGQMKSKKGMMPIADMESLSKTGPF